MSVKVYCDDGHKPRVINQQHNENGFRGVRLKCPSCRLDLRRNIDDWAETVEKLDTAGVSKVSLLALARFAT